MNPTSSNLYTSSLSPLAETDGIASISVELAYNRLASSADASPTQAKPLAYVTPPFPIRPGMADPNRVRGVTLYCTLLGLTDLFFFLKAELVPVIIQTISVITKNHFHLQKNYHRSGVLQNLYTYTESHLLLQTLILIHV